MVATTVGNLTRNVNPGKNWRMPCENPGVGTFGVDVESLGGGLWKTPEMYADLISGEVIGNDPAHNDGPAIRAAIAAGGANVFVRFDGTKTYYILDGDPLIGGAYGVYIANKAAVLDFSTAKIVMGANKVTFFVLQTPTVDTVVTGITNNSSRVFETVSPNANTNPSSVTKLDLPTAGFSQFDVVHLASNDQIPGMEGNASDYELGEFAIAQDIDAGAGTIWLNKQTYDTFTLSAGNLRLARYRPNTVIFLGGEFNHTDAGLAGNWTGTHIWFQGTVDGRILGARVTRSFGHGILDNSNYNLQVQAYISNCIPTTRTGYGLYMQCSFGTRAILKGRNCRHLVTCNPRPASASEFHARRGRNQAAVVHDSHSDGCRNAAFDMHGDAQGCVFAFCLGTGSIIGYSSFGCVFQLAGENNFLDGCFGEGQNGLQVLNRSGDDTPSVGLNLCAYNCDFVAENIALHIENSNKTDTANVEFRMFGGRLSGKGVFSNYIISSWKGYALLMDVVIQPVGAGTKTILACKNRSNFRLERCRLDLTRATGTWNDYSMDAEDLGHLTGGVADPIYASRLPYIDWASKDEISLDMGDAGLTHTMTQRSAKTLTTKTPITAPRSTTLPACGGPNRIFSRDPLATGADPWNIVGPAGTLKALAAGNWCEVAWQTDTLVTSDKWVMFRSGPV